MNEENLGENPPKSIPVWLAVVLVIILLAILTTLGYYLYKNQQESNSEPTGSSKTTTSNTGNEIDTSSWQTYENSSKSFSILVPPSFREITPSQNEGGMTFTDSDDDSQASLPETFANIWSEPNTQNLTLDEVIEEFKQSIQLWPINDFQIVSENDITIDNLPAKKIVTSHYDLQTQIQHISGLACAIKDNKIYKINFIVSAANKASADATWAEIGYIFDKMISAFIFI